MSADHAIVWDTKDLPAPQAFDAFRDAVSTKASVMPWTPERRYEYPFSARLEGMMVENGFVGRIRTVPLVSVRTRSNVANSALDCICVTYIGSGEAEIELDGTSIIGSAGDLLIFDGEKEAIHRYGKDACQDEFALLIPKAQLSDTRDVLCKNMKIPRELVLPPLSTCLRFMAVNMLTSSPAEMGALFDACQSLLPLAAGRCVSREDETEFRQSENVIRALFSFIDRELSNVHLSARSAAEHLGVSDRYVHKLLASSGMTFSGHVTARRLEQVRADLLSPLGRSEPISVVAYRWGFNDLSYFNRAFRKRYGMSPRRLRASESQ